MDVAQLLHELALVADVAVVVALLPEDAAGSSQVSAQKRCATWAPGPPAKTGARTWATDRRLIVAA